MRHKEFDYYIFIDFSENLIGYLKEGTKMNKKRNRIGNSLNLLTASSLDFSYLHEGGTGFVKVLSSINIYSSNDNYLNFLAWSF